MVMIDSDFESTAALGLHEYLHARDSGLAHDLIGAPRGRILDVGSGDGGDLDLLESRGWSPVGIDPTGRGHHARGSVIGVGESLPFRNGSFSGATSILVLPHVADPPRVVREIHRVLRPGALAAFVVFSASPLNARIALAQHTPPGASHSFNARLFTRRAIRRLLQTCFHVAYCERSDFLPWMTGRMPPLLRSRILWDLDRLDSRLSRSPVAFLARKIVAVGVKA